MEVQAATQVTLPWSQVANMSTGYPYRPLVGSAIRLIRILPPEDGSEMLCCKLIHMVLDVSPPPQYIALSYSWGDESDCRTIQLDGSSISIRSNLWHALGAIYQWEASDAARGYGPWHMSDIVFRNRRPWLVWADALCINQADSEEKAIQIPRMGSIYSSATEVLGWLGHLPPPGTDPAVINDVFEKAKEIHNIFRSEGPTALVNLKNKSLKGLEDTLLGDVGNVDRFVETVYAIAQLPYFCRLWIIQEYALNDAVMALGPHVFDADGFTSLLFLLSYRTKWFDAPVHLACLEAMGWIRDQIAPFPLRGKAKAFVDFRLHEQDQPSEDDDDISAWDKFARRLQTVLDLTATAPFKATQQHDMIYGLLGLVSPPGSMPSELSVNYAEDWAEVCRRYARFIAERTGSISFLTRYRFRQNPNSPSGRQGIIPTWVPDFRVPSITLRGIPLYLTKGERYHQGRGEVSFSGDGRAMTLQGYALGPPVAFTRGRAELHQKYIDSFLGPDHPEHAFFRRADASEFLDQILRPAASWQGHPIDDVIAWWVESWERALDRSSDASSEARLISRTFRSWLLKGRGPEQLRVVPAPSASRPNGTKIAGRVFSDRGLLVWQRLHSKTIMKNWLVTADGRGWMALYLHEAVVEGDEIVVLRGLEEHPAVLRKVESTTWGDRCYELVGLLIERVPLAGEPWERGWEQILERKNSDWERITLV